jgi:hypothetical protein
MKAETLGSPGEIHRECSFLCSKIVRVYERTNNSSRPFGARLPICLARRAATSSRKHVKWIINYTSFVSIRVVVKKCTLLLSAHYRVALYVFLPPAGEHDGSSLTRVQITRGRKSFPLLPDYYYYRACARERLAFLDGTRLSSPRGGETRAILEDADIPRRLQFRNPVQIQERISVRETRARETNLVIRNNGKSVYIHTYICIRTSIYIYIYIENIYVHIA